MAIRRGKAPPVMTLHDEDVVAPLHESGIAGPEHPRLSTGSCRWCPIMNECRSGSLGSAALSDSA